MSPYQANTARVERRVGRPPSRSYATETGWISGGAAPSATEKNAERNGSTRLPSELVPSGNSSRSSPAASRPRMASRSRPVAPRCRVTNTVRPSRATRLTPGQRAISSLETKQASSCPPSTGMSSQEQWLAAYTTRRPWPHAAGTPMRRTCSPIRRANTDQ